MELLDEPKSSSTTTTSEWISCIDGRLMELQQNNKDSTNYIIPFASYDNTISLYYENKDGIENGNPKPNVKLVGNHEQPVLALSSYSRTENNFDLASACQDGSVYVWSLQKNFEINEKGQNETAFVNFELQGHQGAVEDVAFDPTGNLIATCGWDEDIKIWSLDDVIEDEEKNSKTKRKKIKETQTKNQKIKSRSSLLGHNQCISSIKWLSNDQIISGSWDHSIRIWDVESRVCINHYEGNKVILCLDHSNLNQLFVTGHADRKVSLWDPRVSIQSQSLTTSLLSHTGWVSSVKWHPVNPNLFISGAYDSSIKVWDIRASIPIHTLPSQHQNKVFDLQWLNQSTFTSGGDDQQIRFYK